MIRRRAPGDAAPPTGPTRGRVTALTPQRHDPERVNVFLDGVFAFGLGLDLALREGVAVGDDLDAPRVAALIAADEAGKATGAALALLARRPRSEREVRDRLRQKGYGPGAIDAAVERLAGWNYLDDAAFARYWVENRAAHKPRGERLLAQELRRKGVDRETVAETIAAAEVDEASAALALARAKRRAYDGLEPAVARRRLGAYLGRRGYGYDVIGPVLDQAFGEAEEWDGADRDDEDAR
jgi:regulatory protein